jgi:formylglycine-generating enzyme required for sulfatase activity
MHFCIDRYEYPNKKGEYPVILVDFNEGRNLCSAQKKRLCTEDEWTFACEGEEAQPYPNGYTRDADVCVNDHPARRYDSAAFSLRTDEKAVRELDKLWQGEPSGARPGCKSPFGVYDMTGNVDEWTRSTLSKGRPSILKGGYWGPVRTRCRPSTRAHGGAYVFYQQGLRCCSDTPTK